MEERSGPARSHGQPKVAIVTGAASGLGEATTSVLTGAGHTVVALDLRPRTGTPAVDDSGQPAWFAVDVSSEDAVNQTVEKVVDRFGRVDVVVNCAGIDHTYWIEDLTVEQFDRVLGVNLRGPFLLAKSVWPVMRRQGGGHIVNVASTAAVRAWSGASAYHASKFGLLGLSRGLGVEGRECGIDVTTIIPGGMQTHFFDRFADQGIPMPEVDTLQDPINVARTILYAISMPPGSVVQEIIVTPRSETSWP